MVNQAKTSLLALIEPILQEHQLILWDLSIKQAGGQKVVQLLVDRPDHVPVSMEALTNFTQDINECLDTADPDPVPGAYLLDISSPGTDRPLIEPWHYRWAMEEDEPVIVALFAAMNGQKKWQGKVADLTDDGVTLLIDGQPQNFHYADISKAILDVQF